MEISLRSWIGFFNTHGSFSRYAQIQTKDKLKQTTTWPLTAARLSSPAQRRMFVPLDADRARWGRFGHRTHAACYRNILLNTENQVRFNCKLRVHAHVHRHLNNTSCALGLFWALFSRKTSTFQHDNHQLFKLLNKLNTSAHVGSRESLMGIMSRCR